MISVHWSENLLHLFRICRLDSLKWLLWCGVWRNILRYDVCNFSHRSDLKLWIWSIFIHFWKHNCLRRDRTGGLLVKTLIDLCLFILLGNRSDFSVGFYKHGILFLVWIRLDFWSNLSYCSNLNRLSSLGMMILLFFLGFWLEILFGMDNWRCCGYQLRLSRSS